MAEYELEAELTYEFRKRGADAHAYTPIVAGGANACVLHYVADDKILNDHTLVLIDAGCEVAGYAADISRTFPVNGRFNAAQKDVYKIVLAAQAAAIEATAPGRHFMEGHDAAVRVLTQGLIDLKLLAGKSYLLYKIKTVLHKNLISKLGKHIKTICFILFRLD